ncbi:hypothetical protein BGX28_000171, partial [Mortierella sp. GBA30]
LLANGNYRIYYGNYQVPSKHRFWQAAPDARDGNIRIYTRNESPLQVWKLTNQADGQVTLESNGARGKYLSLGRSGANLSAYVGVTTTVQPFNITRVAGGPFTSYELAYPKRAIQCLLNSASV